MLIKRTKFTWNSPSTIFTVSVGYKTSDLHRLHVTLSDIGDFDTFLGSLLLVNAIYILFSLFTPY